MRPYDAERTPDGILVGSLMTYHGGMSSAIYALGSHWWGFLIHETTTEHDRYNPEANTPWSVPPLTIANAVKELEGFCSLIESRGQDASDGRDLARRLRTRFPHAF